MNLPIRVDSSSASSLGWTTSTKLFLSLGRLARYCGALVACVFALNLAAQTTGSLQGVITDANARVPVANAMVRVEGTGLETATDNTGAYRLPSVPAGEHKLTISYIGLEPGSASVVVTAGQVATRDVALGGGVLLLQAVKVESVREGQMKAINEQRASNTISNIIASDAIGNLPDNTLGEALSRVPGVNVVQSEGEASYVTIRGAAPQLNSIRVDGQTLPAITDPLAQDSSSDNRSINVSLIPSEIIGSVEVVKALTPDTDANSIGGQVNIRTRAGFDVATPVISGGFDSYNSDLKNRWGYGASLSFVGAVNEARTVGLGIDVNYRNIALAEVDSETGFYPKTDPAVSGIAGIKGDGSIAEYDVRFRQQRKITAGLSANLDWKVGTATVLKFRTFYNDAEKYQTKFRTRATALTTFSATSTDTLASGTSSRLRKAFYDQQVSTKIYQVGASGETGLTNGSLAYAASYNYNPVHSRLNRYDTDTPSATRRQYSWTVDRTNPVLPVVRMFNTATGANGFSAGDDTLLSIWKQTGNDAERNYSGNADYTRVEHFGAVPVSFKFGAKYAGKLRRQRPVMNIWAPVSAPAMKTFPLSDLQPGGNLLFGSVPTLGAFASQPAVFNSLITNPANYVISTNTALNTLLSRIYDVSEDVTAGYGMATAKFGKLETIAGLRMEQTKNDFNWLGGSPHVRGSTTYDNLFPDVLLNYRFTKNHILRAAWTRSIARPDYNELVPYTLLNDPAPSIDTTPGTLPQLYKGNSDLRAAKSTNYDLSFEWYYQPAGLASIGVFHKDITGFIYRSTTIQTLNGTPTAVHQFQNGATAKETGLELSWQQTLTFLPGALSGLGFSANTTVIDGKSSAYLLNATTNTQVLTSDKFIPGQPKAIQNFQVYWEKYGITARVAFNYVSANINATDGHVPNATVAPARQLDATLKYRLTKNLVVYLQGKNLRRQMQHWYDNGNPNLNEETDYLGRSFVGGVKFHF
jgi:TonB-dependent receptor